MFLRGCSLLRTGAAAIIPNLDPACRASSGCLGPRPVAERGCRSSWSSRRHARGAPGLCGCRGRPREGAWRNECLRGCEEIHGGPDCERDDASCEARRRDDAGTSYRRHNEADGVVPPQDGAAVDIFTASQRVAAGVSLDARGANGMFDGPARQILRGDAVAERRYADRGAKCNGQLGSGPRPLCNVAFLLPTPTVGMTRRPGTAKRK
jgi:hypothetical protein